MRTTKINANIILNEPDEGIRYGTDALLLADFAYRGAKKGRVLDLGTGSGVIPLLLIALGSGASFFGVELQAEFASVARKNASDNGVEDRFTVICDNAENCKTLFPAGSIDCVVTNPPFMRSDSGRHNDSAPLSVARREVHGGAELFCRAASRVLGSGGSFFCVYRPDRLVHLFCAMRDSGIEPKRLRAVVPSVEKKPSLVLVEGKKDAREGLIYEPDLILYTDSTHSESSSELSDIYRRFDGRNG